MSKKRWVSLIVTWFCSEIWTWIFRIFGFDSVFLVGSCLKSEWNCESSSSYLPVQNLRISLLLLNPWSLWSCLSLPLSMVNSHWNCRENDSMMKIQCWISENHCKLHWILLNFWFWKTLGFVNCSLFLMNFGFDPNCQERESWKCVCDVARDMWILILTCTVVAFYRLPHVPLSQ